MGKAFLRIAGRGINRCGNLAKSIKVTKCRYPFGLNMETGHPDSPLQRRSCCPVAGSSVSRQSSTIIPFKFCLNCKEFPHLRSMPPWGNPSPINDGRGGIKTQPFHPTWADSGRSFQLHSFPMELAEAAWCPSQFSFSFCSIPLPPPSFHRCWSQGHALINILNSKFKFLFRNGLLRKPNL